MRKLPGSSNFGSANNSKDGDGVIDANKKPSAGLDLVREKIDSFRTSQQQYIPGAFADQKKQADRVAPPLLLLLALPHASKHAKNAALCCLRCMQITRAKPQA